jgi:SET domain-containing protein
MTDQEMHQFNALRKGLNATCLVIKRLLAERHSIPMTDPRIDELTIKLVNAAADMFEADARKDNLQ